MKLIVTTSSGVITNNTLYELQAILRRNTPPECTKPIGDLTRQLLDLTEAQLKDCSVFQGRFKDGSKVYFVDRLPPGVPVQTAVLTMEEKYP